ncbi:uncharacterized protein CIMG_09095 [Coccidioides immitis RS]|uniref:Uncharacterized protein n=4 Tax=Coccidioides immitis TaxID=5501 RepID=J3K1L6_COCIM|nr:uncharacterized protein CIMG_09095 [Coccidioides immitis RS]EAS27891.3 hypothetical protein CIMG_09095 [Coccidioides immitis RS]KMP08685.1 hypothetical protein CIRG_08366 [Coccidioides immitis RMSCC 2394]KMU78677.1 hypothetical protein CISG_01717 [Coccidioides immitis RMSCC 3703]KMU87496.1 hypothetical protein CIHG_05292 [Coccidioides immitis H538.4]
MELCKNKKGGKKQACQHECRASLDKGKAKSSLPGDRGTVMERRATWWRTELRARRGRVKIKRRVWHANLEQDDPGRHAMVTYLNSLTFTLTIFKSTTIADCPNPQPIGATKEKQDDMPLTSLPLELLENISQLT